MGSFSNKYLSFCPNSATYLLGKQRNLDKSLSEQKNFHLHVIFLMRKALINLT